jgi:hypothetical protein
MGKGEGPGTTGVPMDNTIQSFLASTMNDYGHCFRSTVPRMTEDEGRDRDYFHSAQPSPRALGPGVYADKEDPDRADGVGRTSFLRPTPPAYSSPREQRFTSVFKTVDIDPKWTMDHDTKAWTDRGGLVAGNAFGKEQRGTMIARSYCNGQCTELGAPERSGKNNLEVNSHRSKFESRIDRFGASPPREEKNETMATKTAKAAALRGPGIHDQGNGRGPKQTYDWRKDHFMKRPNSVFVLPKARQRPRHHMASAGSAHDSLGPGCYEHDSLTSQQLKERSRPSAAFRTPSKPVGHRSPYHKGPDSTWSLKTDARHWTKNSSPRGFAWGGGRAERPLNDRLTQRGAVATGKMIPAKS